MSAGVQQRACGLSHHSVPHLPVPGHAPRPPLAVRRRRPSHPHRRPPRAVGGAAGRGSRGGAARGRRVAADPARGAAAALGSCCCRAARPRVGPERWTRALALSVCWRGVHSMPRLPTQPQHPCTQLSTSNTQLERVVLAKSGVLLLTWTDPTGALTALRRRLRDHFPGHSPKQPFTIHTSLWRIVGPPGAQLPPDAVRAVAGEARRWTEQVGSAGRSGAKSLGCGGGRCGRSAAKRLCGPGWLSLGSHHTPLHPLPLVPKCVQTPAPAPGARPRLHGACGVAHSGGGILNNPG